MLLSTTLSVGLLAATLAQAPEAPPAVRLTRLADPVAWLDAEARTERHLFFFDKRADLRVGDGVRQGVAGLSELAFEDYLRLRLFGDTEVWLESEAATAHVLRFVRVHRAAIDVPAGSTATIQLPGGYALTATDTWFRVAVDELGRRYEVKNAGPGEVRVVGPTVPDGAAAVAAGGETELTMVEEPAAVAARAVSRPGDVFEGLAVRLQDGQESVREGDALVVRGAGTARIGGARVRIPAGAALRVRRPPPADAADPGGGE